MRKDALKTITLKTYTNKEATIMPNGCTALNF